MHEVPGNDPAPWNLLHDGVIVGARKNGTTVDFIVECNYLRERFDDPGAAFVLELSGSEHVELKPHDQPPITAPEKIPHVEPIAPIIYDADLDGDAIVVSVENATLSLKYSSLRIVLDNGRVVPLAELKRHATDYWDDFSKRTPSGNP